MKALLTKVKKLRSIPFNLLVKKILYKLYLVPFKLYRKNWIKIKPIRLSEKYLNVFVPNYNFFFEIQDKKSVLINLKKMNVSEQIIDDADKVCNHIFNLLGSGDIYLGEKIPWNKDFKSNYVWENDFYLDIKKVNLFNNADIKVPWELSRFQHLFTLGKAYWLTDDDKYVKEFKEEIEDWIIKNPIEMSVNWTCTMDVAIRAVNWITAYSFFRDSKILGDDFWKDFHKTLYLHGKFIYKNLENNGTHTGNHYLSNIVGLVWLGLYFDSLTNIANQKSNSPKKWLEFGLKELEKEMLVQNNSDGSNYEASTSYHRLVTELFLITTIFCKNNHLVFSETYMERLEKMCEFILDITKPNGLAPLIGDADDGRLVILTNYSNWEKNDFRHLLGIAGELFDRNDFRFHGHEYAEDTYWIYNNFNIIQEPPLQLKSKAYNVGGYYILRNNYVYSCIRCGELSFHGEGVHSHNDQLSFELNILGEDFIVDPGSYIYTADYKMRNYFRSTFMHNTLQIENLEQNIFDDHNLFYMKEITNSDCIEFNHDYFEGVHYGYKRFNNTIHKREVILKNSGIQIYDNIESEVKTKNKVIYHLNPNVDIQIVNNNAAILKSNNVSVSFRVSKGEIQLSDSWISVDYGVKVKGKVIIIKFNENNLVSEFILS